MAEIYWITRLCNLQVLFIIILATSIVGLIVLFVFYAEEEHELMKVWIKRFFISLVMSGIALVFVPSKKDLLLIYGVGSVYDFIKENPTAKQLPEKAVKALDEWLSEESSK